VNPHNRPEVSQILTHPFFEEEVAYEISSGDLRSSTDASEDSSPKVTLKTPSPPTFQDKYRGFVETMKAHNSHFQSESRKMFT
jgi:hypothetical protein